MPRIQRDEETQLRLARETINMPVAAAAKREKVSAASINAWRAKLRVTEKQREGLGAIQKKFRIASAKKLKGLTRKTWPKHLVELPKFELSPAVAQSHDPIVRKIMGNGAGEKFGDLVQTIVTAAEPLLRAKWIAELQGSDGAR